MTNEIPVGELGVGVIAAGYILDKVFKFLSNKEGDHETKRLQILEKLTYITGEIKQDSEDTKTDVRSVKQTVNNTHERVGRMELTYGELNKEMSMNNRTLDKLHERLDRMVDRK